MKLVRASEFARDVGINRNTMKAWFKSKRHLFVKKSGHYYLKLDALAGCDGIDIVDAMTLPGQRWVRAVDLAHDAGIPRKTVANWCRARPNFAKRIGKVWYVDIASLGASPEEAEALRKWAPDRKTLITFVDHVGGMSQLAREGGMSESV